MTGSGRGWETEKAGADQRVRRLAGDWYERSAATVGRGYDQWYDPVVDDLVTAALAGGDVDEALVRLGAARAHVGYGEAEGKADLMALVRAVPVAAREAVSGDDAMAAFRAGYESVGPGSFPRARLFGDADDLRERLADLYARESDGITAGDTHALVVVSAVGDGDAAGETVHTCGQTLVEKFGSAERVAWLGGASFAVVVRRHPGLAVGITALASVLETEPAVASADLVVGFEALPAGRAGLATLVSGMIDGTLPRWRVGDEHVERELVDSPTLVSPVHEAAPWERRRERVAATWRSGLSLVSVALATLLVAVGVARVLGPVGEGIEPTATTIFGPALGSPRPERVAASSGVAVASLSDAHGATSGEAAPGPVVAAAPATGASSVTGPVAAEPTARAPADPAPTPPPPPESETAEPSAAPAAEQEEDPPPCADLTGKALKHCEREVRIAEAPGERGMANGRDGDGDRADRGSDRAGG